VLYRDGQFKVLGQECWQMSGSQGMTYDCLRLRESPIFRRIFPVSLRAS
jgi:hypothetical protein